MNFRDGDIWLTTRVIGSRSMCRQLKRPRAEGTAPLVISTLSGARLLGSARNQGMTGTLLHLVCSPSSDSQRKSGSKWT